MKTELAISPDVQSLLRAGAAALQAGSTSSRLDAEVLLAHTLATTRAWLYANPEAAVAPDRCDVYMHLLGLRAGGRPLAQLTGEREFWSLPLEVNDYTLIPRPETELLVECALRLLPADAGARVLDAGTGSGAIAIALASERPGLALVATDLDERTLDVAQANATRLCPGQIEFRCGDWFNALDQRCAQFDVIVSNPPYIGTDETGLTDRELAFEPVVALYSGRDGLDSLRTIIRGAGHWLLPGGWLLLEHGFRQGEAVAALLQAAGYVNIEHHRDAAGHLRVTAARWPATD